MADLVWLEEAHADLHSAALAIRHLVEAPLQVDLQQFYQLLPPLCVHPIHPKDHFPCTDVPLPTSTVTHFRVARAPCYYTQFKVRC